MFLKYIKNLFKEKDYLELANLDQLSNFSRDTILYIKTHSHKDIVAKLNIRVKSDASLSVKRILMDDYKDLLDIQDYEIEIHNDFISLVEAVLVIFESLNKSYQILKLN